MRHSEDTVALLVGAVFRKARQKKHWTIQDTATRAGISRGYLHEIERGAKAPSLYVAARLCHALSLSLFDLEEACDLNRYSSPFPLFKE